jgi:integrase
MVDCHKGMPLSLSSMNKLFVTLRSRVPELPADLTPHQLRRSWNTTFSNAMDRKGVPGEQEAKFRAHLMGWRSEDSARPYLRRTIRRRSNEALREMQDKLDIQHAGAEEFDR